MSKILNIGGLIPKLPLIQGGMAVGISLDNLAAAVANEGGIGVIGTAGIGMTVENFTKNYKEASIEGLEKIIRKAKEKTSGIIGVNIMVALSNYSDMVTTAIKEKVDIIISGAGLPLDLPSYLPVGSKTKLVPIVSGLKSATLIFRRWMSKYNYIPDAFIVEGPKAGGHLGYKNEDLTGEDHQLEKTIPELKEFCDTIKKEHGKEVPIIAAGGIYEHLDVEKVIALGASGVQVGTAFIATEECDADIKFKETIINATENDITIIKSPVGMPGRAVKNKFVEDVEAGVRKPIRCNYRCIRTCNMIDAPYCIAEALMNASKGDLENGFAFTGTNGYKVDRIYTVKEIVNRLFPEHA